MQQVLPQRVFKKIIVVIFFISTSHLISSIDVISRLEEGFGCFQSINISGMRISKESLFLRNRIDFLDASLVALKNVTFSMSILHQANFRHSKLANCCFTGSVLSKASFVKATFCEKVSFELASLVEVDFRGVNRFYNTRFKNAVLKRTLFDWISLPSIKQLGSAEKSFFNIIVLLENSHHASRAREYYKDHFNVVMKKIDPESWSISRYEHFLMEYLDNLFIPFIKKTVLILYKDRKPRHLKRASSV